jgi:hypothetical protein
MCLQTITEATPAAIVREYQETQQALTIHHTRRRTAQRKALNGEFCCVRLLGCAWKVQEAQHVRQCFGLRRAARLARKGAKKKKHKAEREVVIDVLVCVNSAPLKLCLSYCFGVSFSCQQGSPSQAESDEEDLATDQQMLALYDADPVKTEQDFGVDAVFIQELRDHVAEAEQRLARLRQVAVDDIHVYPKGDGK